MVVVSELNGVRTASVVGDLDLSNAQAIRESLETAAEDRDKFVVSFERCGYCDSSGIAILVALQHRLGDGLAVVVPPEAQLRRILSIVGIDRVMRIASSVEEAIAELAAA